MKHDDVRRQRCSLAVFLRGLLPLLIFSSAVHAAAPYFTGLSIVVPAAGGTVNLRSQGTISGSAPMTIQSVSVLPLGLGVSASVVGNICVQVNNLLGIDLLSAGAVLSVLVTNPDAPRGVRGTIVVLPGLAGNNDLNSCSDPSSAPVAEAGGSRSVADTDQVPGEVVTLDGSRSFDPDGTITSYTWTDLTTNQVLGTGAVIQPRLADGNHQIQLTVTDNSGGPQGTASTTLNLAVQAPPAAGNNGSAPTPNPGVDRSLLDTDGLLGELVTLDASASISIGGILSYEWLDAAQNLLGTGVSLSVRLPDGVNNITLRVTGSNLLTSTASINIVVGAPLVDQLLQSLPGLTPGQRAVASMVDNLCARLAELASTQALPAAQVDLLNRCSGLIASTNPIEQVDALDELGAREFTALRTQALLFSNSQHSSILNRLATVRLGGGRSGLLNFNLGGTSIDVDGKPVPIQHLQAVAKKFWEMFADEENGEGGGGNGDENSLLSDRLGLWLRFNHDLGDKALSPVSDGFEGKQWGFTGGADYRFGRRSILGLALGYGQSDIDFQPVDRGGLETTSWTASLYGSAYPLGDLYVDAVFNYSDGDYDTTRHIVYSEGGTGIDRTAFGNTGGKTLSGGLSVGYDWHLGGFTFSPTVGYFHSRADIDAFGESGADGLDLAYDKQDYESSTANLSLSLNYAWSTSWMVVSPHLRGEYLHEFNGDVEVFGVRFANDPFASASNPTPPVVVQSDVPDQWYWRFAAGVSAQFKFGLSGFVEYQRLEEFQFVNFENFTVGLRWQRGL